MLVCAGIRLGFRGEILSKNFTAHTVSLLQIKLNLLLTWTFIDMARSMRPPYFRFNNLNFLEVCIVPIRLAHQGAYKPLCWLVHRRGAFRGGRWSWVVRENSAAFRLRSLSGINKTVRR